MTKTEDEIKYFVVRNAPKDQGGEVIAVWRQDKEEYQLSFGVKDVTYSTYDQDLIRTYARTPEFAIESTLVHEINEGQFSTLIEIADMPQIISDGVLHHLGKLRWSFKLVPPEEPIHCEGTVYVRVVAVSGYSIPALMRENYG